VSTFRAVGLAVGVWAAAAGGAAPQTAPLNVRIHAQDGRSFPCEPSIAVDPTDPRRLVAGSVLDDVYHSDDGGRTWTVDRLRSRHGVYGDPCIVANDRGDFYYFHLSDPSGKGWAHPSLLDRIVVQRSVNGGRTWSRGAGIGLNGAKDQDKEWAAVAPDGRIHACWTQFDRYDSTEPGDSTVILCSSAGRRAVRWTEPVRVSAVAGDCRDGDATVEGSVPAVLPDGTVVVAWGRDEAIWFNRSEDGGRTWLPRETRVADLVGGWNLTIPGIGRANGMPVTVADPSSGRIYVVWCDTRAGEADADVVLVSSDDAGRSWTAPVRVHSDAPGAHQFFTWIAVDPVTHEVHVVYYDRRRASAEAPLATEVWLSSSRDGGKTWTDQCVSESPFEPGKARFFGDYTNVTAYGGRVWPIWTREDAGKLSIWTALVGQSAAPTW
jgi:hypothetical protein